MLEAGDRAGVQRGSLGEIGLRPSALVAEPFQLLGKLDGSGKGSRFVDARHRLALDYIGLTDDLIIHGCVPIIIPTRTVATCAPAAKCKDTALRTRLCVAHAATIRRITRLEQ